MVQWASTRTFAEGFLLLHEGSYKLTQETHQGSRRPPPHRLRLSSHRLAP